MSDDRDIYVTGVGLISAIGNSAGQHIQSLLNAATGIGMPRIIPSRHSNIPVGEVKMTTAELAAHTGLGEPFSRLRSVLLGAAAVNEAIDMAGLQPADLERCALINGTTVGGMDNTERHYEAMRHGDKAAAREFTYNSCGTCTRLIAEATGIKGFTATSSTACSSAANAIITAARMIQAGLCDTAIAGGTEALTRFHFNGFRSLMILDTERCRPFDTTRNGINLGEGAGYIVLESSGKAKQRQAVRMARLSGWANRCDAFHQTASSDNGEGAYLAMCQALQTAGLRPDQIDYINTHGTATLNNDASELCAMHRVFGQRLPLYSSTKSLTGHTTSASGGIEAAICVLGLHHKFIPSGMATEHPLEQASPPLQHTLTGRNYRASLCNAFGFGGNDSTLIFTRDDSD